MEPVATWEKVLIGVVVLLVLLWMRPGIKAMFEQSRQATERDWKGLLIPLALVILFVMLLIYAI
jgi:hypothetical protein